jgi:hypothetical protein
VSVSVGAGAAWIPRAMLDILPGTAVHAHSLGEAGHTALYFIWRSGQLTRNAQRLLDLL